MTVDAASLTPKVKAMLTAAIAREYETVTGLMAEIATDAGTAGVWATCGVLAELFKGHLGADAPGAFTFLRVTDEHGKQLDPGALPVEMRPRLWATRFVTAWCNGDKDTAMALFRASFDDPEGHVAGVSALISMTAGVLRSSAGDAS